MRIEAGSVVLTRRQSALIVTLADLSRLRRRNQHANDPELADLLQSLESAANEYVAGCAGATRSGADVGAVAQSRPMTPAQAAARLGISASAVRRALDENRLDGQKTNGRWTTTEAAVEAFAPRPAPSPASGIADLTIRHLLQARAEVLDVDEFVTELRDAGLRFAVADDDRGHVDRASDVGVILLHTDGTHAAAIPAITGDADAALPGYGSAVSA